MVVIRYLQGYRKLPNVPKIYEDEILYSYLVRLAHANGFSSLKEFVYHTGILPEASDLNKRYRTVRYEIQSDLYPLMDVMGVGDIGAPELYLKTSLYPLVYPLSTKAISSHHIGMLSKYRSQSNLITPLNDVFRDLKFCPTCRIADQQKYGEWYYHRSHQIPGVTVCHRHAVPLCQYAGEPELLFEAHQPSKILEAKEKSIEYAIFSHDLLHIGLQADLTQLAYVTLLRMKQMGYSKQNVIPITEDMGTYADLLNTSLHNLFRYFPPKGKINMTDCLALLLYLFQDATTLSQKLLVTDQSKEIQPIIQGRYELVSPYRENLIELQCLSCGQYFLTTPYRLQSDWGCPNCDALLGDEALLQKLFHHASGDDYDLISSYRLAEKIKIRHKACGREYWVRTRSFLEEHQRCQCHHVKSCEEVARRVSLCGNFTLLRFDAVNLPMDVIHNDCGSIICRKYSRFIRHPVCSCLEMEKPPKIKTKKPQNPNFRTGDKVFLWLTQHYGAGEPIVTRTLTINGFSHHNVTQTMNNLYRAGKLDRVSYGVYTIRKGENNAKDY